MLAVLYPAILSPSGVAGLDLNFASGRYALNGPYGSGFPTGWTYTGTGTGRTALDLAGNVVQFAPGVPRITDRGLLVEESRTNLLLRSQEFDNASWSKSAATVTADATAAPDGTTTADKIVEDTTTASHHVLQSVSIAASAVYTASFYLKAAERNTAVIWLSNAATADRAQADVTLSGAGSITISTPGGTPFTGASGTITALANDWYRVTLTATTAGGAITLQSRIYVRQQATYAGTAGWGLFAWGAQLELGAFATSPIITTGAAATWGADTVSVGGLAYGSTALTLFTETEANATSQNNAAYAALYQAAGPSNNRVSCRNAVTTTTVFVSSGGVLQSGDVIGAAPTSGTEKGAVRLALNDVRSVRNGTLSALDTSAALPLTLDTLNIGKTEDSALYLNRYIRRVRILNYAASDAQLQALTT